MYAYIYIYEHTDTSCLCVFRFNSLYFVTQYRFSQLLTILVYAIYNFFIVWNLIILRFLQSKTTYLGFYIPALKRAAAGTKRLIRPGLLCSLGRGTSPSLTTCQQLQTGVTTTALGWQSSTLEGPALNAGRCSDNIDMEHDVKFKRYERETAVLKYLWKSFHGL